MLIRRTRTDEISFGPEPNATEAGCKVWAIGRSTNSSFRSIIGCLPSSGNVILPECFRLYLVVGTIGFGTKNRKPTKVKRMKLSRHAYRFVAVWVMTATAVASAQ